MKQLDFPRENPSSVIYFVLRTTILIATALVLPGCLLSSPYWNQAFDSHTAKIPLQAWVSDKTLTVKFQCAQASHGGLYPFGSPPSWHLIANVAVADTPIYDPAGAAVYTAGLHTALPAQCWRQDPANGVWYAAVRASHPTSDGPDFYRTVDKAGLECAGRENGKAASWYGWYTQGCYKKYSNSNAHIPYAIIRASS